MIGPLIIISEIQHALMTLGIGLLLYWRFRDWRLIPICFLTGFLIDVDHWADLWSCFGFNFSLDTFFNFDYVYQCHRIIVPLHGWEYLPLWWLLGRWLGRKWRIRGLEWALSLPFFGHLCLDHFAVKIFSRHPLAYSLIHRWRHHFSLESFNGW